MHLRTDEVRGTSVLRDHVVSRMSLPDTFDMVAALAVQEVRGTEFTVVALSVSEPHSPGAVASNAVALDLYEAERAADDGPCLNTLDTGSVICVDRTTDPGKWPMFRAACTQQGVLSALFVPLTAAGSRIGALGLYAESAHAYRDNQIDVAVEFAASAAVVLTNATDFWSARESSDSLSSALASRAAIEQAKGILMHSVSCGPDEAFMLLAEQSQLENRKVGDVAVELVSRMTAVASDRLGSADPRRT